MPFIERRLERLSRIDDAGQQGCPILYIGSSKNLRQRVEQLLCKEDRHTIEHPVRALLLGGWRIECAWKPTPRYREEEKQLKTAYKSEHSGALPPLVDR
jgi:cell division inhibitor SulA